MINGIILASGYGKRMGKEKLLLPIRGKAVVEYIIDVVLNFPFNDIVLVGREEAVIKLSRSKGIRTVVNNEAHRGQSQSVKMGILNSLPAEGYMFFTGDQPFVRKRHLDKLVSKFYEDRNSIIVPRCGEERGTPVIFPSEFKEELLNLDGDQGGRAVMQAHPERIVFVDVEDRALFFDIDTPMDYEEALMKGEYRNV